VEEIAPQDNPRSAESKTSKKDKKKKKKESKLLAEETEFDDDVDMTAS
jgi:hypothetical protein